MIEHPRVSLIPRYNWDFGLRSLADSVSTSIGLRRTDGAALARSFPHTPILTTSGRASLVAILRALKLPKNARVAVPLYCCSVVFEAIEFAGCKCEFTDISDTDYGISPDELGKKISGVSAAVVVHMFGHPVDMNRIRSATGKVPVIEDCAHSLFSSFEGLPTGSFGDASFFSFRNGKYLSAGEASVILAHDPQLRSRIMEVVGTFEQWPLPREIIHAAGSLVKSMAYRKPLYGLAGYPLGLVLDAKLNLSDKTGIDLQQISRGYLGLVARRLDDFHENIERQRSISLALLERIHPGKLMLPRESTNVQSNYYQFAIRLHSESDRDELASSLFARGIDTAKYLDDIAETARRLYGYTGNCPTAERCAKTCLIIPNHYTLKSRDVERIVGAINEWCGLA